MGKRIEELGWRPPKASEFLPYLNARTVPPLNAQKLDAQCLISDQRGTVQTPIAGDFSIVLRYKTREGAVSSFVGSDQDLRVIQLQGARQEGYRVTTGMKWVDFFADQAMWIANHPESGFDRLILPLLGAIEGFETISEDALIRYERFAKLAGMKHSNFDEAFVRDVSR